MVKASKALNIMESCLKRNENEVNGLKARIAELEGCMTMQTTTTSTAATTKDGLTINSIGGSPDGGMRLHESSLLLCRDGGEMDGELLRKTEAENECLKIELKQLQEVVKDLMQQMDHLMNDTDFLDKTERNDKMNQLEAKFEELRGQHDELRQELQQAKKDLEGTAKNLEVKRLDTHSALEDRLPTFFLFSDCQIAATGVQEARSRFNL